MYITAQHCVAASQVPYIVVVVKNISTSYIPRTSLYLFTVSVNCRSRGRAQGVSISIAGLEPSESYEQFFLSRAEDRNDSGPTFTPSSFLHACVYQEP
jgi:hypothetical protein